MVKKKFIFYFLIVGLIPFISASLGTGISGMIGVDLNVNPLDINLGGNYSINVNHSTFSDVWITGLGLLSTANATQFNNNGETLTLDPLWLNTHGNSLWCQLTGCTMSGDFDMGDNDITNANNITATNINSTSYELNGTIITDFDDVWGNTSVNYGVNESDVSQELPFLLTKKGILKIEIGSMPGYSINDTCTVITSPDGTSEVSTWCNN